MDAATGLLGIGFLVRAVFFLGGGFLARLRDVIRALCQIFAVLLFLVDDLFVVLDISWIRHGWWAGFGSVLLSM